MTFICGGNMEDLELYWNNSWQVAEQNRHSALMRELKAELYQVRQEQEAQERARVRAYLAQSAPAAEPAAAVTTSPDVKAQRHPDRVQPRLRQTRQVL